MTGIMLADLFDSNMWIAISAIGTLVSSIATIVYTSLTFSILKSTNKSATANAKTNQLTAYMEIKKDLTTSLFITVCKFARKNNISIFQSSSNGQSVDVGNQYLEKDGLLKISDTCLTHLVLNNIEDLALFYDQSFLTIDLIDSGFGYNILHLGNNIQIREFIQECRNFQPNAFDGFVILYGLIYNRLSTSEKLNYKSHLILE